jgi:hypothetical protein
MFLGNPLFLVRVFDTPKLIKSFDRLECYCTSQWDLQASVYVLGTMIGDFIDSAP